jgi:hypothetical protein
MLEEVSAPTQTSPRLDYQVVFSIPDLSSRMR